MFVNPSNYRIEYPSTWFVYASSQERDGDISSENVPAPMLMSAKGIWLHIHLAQTSSRSGCLGWYRDARDATISYSVASVIGEAYTTGAGPDGDWLRGAAFWSRGRCVSLWFIQYSRAARDANRSIEYQIIDTLRFL